VHNPFFFNPNEKESHYYRVLRYIASVGFHTFWNIKEETGE